MIQQTTTSDIVDSYTSLSLAITKLWDKQEKNWGCFQVQKEGDFCSLYIPALPSFKFYQNPKTMLYRGYWRRGSELPKATDTKSFPPDLWVKKKQKQVQVTLDHKPVGKVNKPSSPQLINQARVSEQKNSKQKTTQVVRKQRIFEIVYRYNPSAEVMRVNQLIALLLREKIIADIVSVPENEIFPLVLIGNPE